MEVFGIIMSIVTAIAGALCFFLFLGPLCVSVFEEIKKIIAEYRLRKPRKEDYVYQQKYTNLFVEYNHLKHDLDEANEKITRYEINASKGDQEIYNLTMQNKELREQNQNLINENKKLKAIIDLKELSGSAPEPIQHFVSPPYPIGWNTKIHALYKNGIKNGRLQTALSEDIARRMISLKIANSINSVDTVVEIIPSSKKSRESGNYQTSLKRCSCEDFTFHNNSRPYACKHMFTLAMELNLITIAGIPLSRSAKK